MPKKNLLPTNQL